MTHGPSTALVGCGEVRDIAYSHDGTTVATAGGNNHTVTLWEADTGEQLRIMVDNRVVSAVSFSPDDRHIATDGALFEAATGARLREWGSGYSVAFSPDGQGARVRRSAVE